MEMLTAQCRFQQEIAEAADEAARKYYDETAPEDRSDTDVTSQMRAAARNKQQSFRGQFAKHLAVANPKFGDKFLQEVSASKLICWQFKIVQSVLVINDCVPLSDHKALQQQREARDDAREASAHCNSYGSPSFQGQVA